MKSLLVRLILYILLILMACTRASTQNKPYLQYTVNDGLPSNNILDIVQDDDGYIWLATDNGISRFDGESFVNYSVDDGLPTEEIWMFHKDRYGRIWLLNSTNSGYYLYNGEIRNIGFTDNNILTPAAHMLYPEGIGLRRTEYLELVNGATVETYDYDYQCLRSISGPLNVPGILIYTLGLSPQKVVDRYTQSFLGIDHPISRQLSNRNKYTHNNIFLSNDSLLASINPKYIILQNLKNKSLDTIIFDSPFKNIHLPKIHGSLIHLDHDDGFIKINLLNGKIIDHHHTKIDVNLNRSIRAGHLILSATTTGMAIFYDPLKIKRASNVKIISICMTDQLKLAKSDQNKILINSDNGVNWENLDLNLSFSPHLAEDGNRCYILSGNIFFEYDKSKERFKGYSVSHVYDQSDNVEVLGYNPLNVFNSVTDIHSEDSSFYKISRYTTFRIPRHSQDSSNAYRLPSKSIISLERGRKNWYVAKPHHILKTDAFLTHFDTLTQFNNSEVKELFKHNNELFVITQNNGLWQITPEITKISDLPSGFIQHTTLHQDYLYYNTHDKVCGIDLTTGKMKCHLMGYSLPRIQIQELDSDDEIIYLLSTDGQLYCFNPQEMAIPKDTPRIRLTIPSRTIRRTEDNNYSLRDASFQVNWKLRDLKSLGKLSINYRMLPYDSTWISTTDETIQFINLAPGDYTLQVQGEGAYNNQTEILSIGIVIPEKWYASNWFYVIFILSMIALSTIVVRALNERFRRREQEKNVLKEKFAQLELDALRAQMNPHFIFNSLAAIQAFIRQSKKEEADDYLSQFAQLIRQFLDQSRSREIRLEDEIKLLKNYVELENLRFDQQIDFKLEVSHDLDTYQKIPSLLLQPFVENAIQHGLFHKEGYKSLKIKMSQKGDIIDIAIEDNGVGRLKAQKINQANRPQHRSKGLKMLRERIDTLNAAGEYLISYSIEDLGPEQASGTIIKLNIQHL